MDQEETLIRWNSSLTEWLIPNNIFLSLYLIVGVFGNALVLFIYIFRMRNGKDDRYFIPSLAAVDICACTIGASYALALNLLPVRFPGDFLCKVLWFLSQSSTISSSLLLLVIAVHRYMKVCKPLKPKWSLKYKRLAVGLSITSAVVVSLPTFAFYGEIQIYNAELNVTGYRCSHVHESTVGYDFLILYNIILFVCACGGIVVISTLYVLVGKSIYAKVIQFRKSMRRPKKIPTPVYSVSADNNHNAFNDVRGQTTTLSEEGKTSMSSELPNGSAQNDAVMEDEASGQSVQDKTNTKSRESRSRFSRELLHVPNVRGHFLHYRYSYMFMTIAFIFVISYLPRIILMLLESIFDTFWMKSDKTIAAMLFLYRMYILNHVTNPFVYGFFDGTFRQEVKSLFCKCKGHVNNHEINKSSS